jgi:hypothetical protein
MVQPGLPAHSFLTYFGGQTQIPEDNAEIISDACLNLLRSGIGTYVHVENRAGGLVEYRIEENFHWTVCTLAFLAAVTVFLLFTIIGLIAYLFTDSHTANFNAWGAWMADENLKAADQAAVAAATQGVDAYLAQPDQVPLQQALGAHLGVLIGQMKQDEAKAWFTGLLADPARFGNPFLHKTLATALVHQDARGVALINGCTEGEELKAIFERLITLEGTDGTGAVRNFCVKLFKESQHAKDQKVIISCLHKQEPLTDLFKQIIRVALADGNTKERMEAACTDGVEWVKPFTIALIQATDSATLQQFATVIGTMGNLPEDREEIAMGQIVDAIFSQWDPCCVATVVLIHAKVSEKGFFDLMAGSRAAFEFLEATSEIEILARFPDADGVDASKLREKLEKMAEHCRVSRAIDKAFFDKVKAKTAELMLAQDDAGLRNFAESLQPNQYLMMELVTALIEGLKTEDRRDLCQSILEHICQIDLNIAPLIQSAIALSRDKPLLLSGLGAHLFWFSTSIQGLSAKSPSTPPGFVSVGLKLFLEDPNQLTVCIRNCIQYGQEEVVKLICGEDSELIQDERFRKAFGRATLGWSPIGNELLLGEIVSNQLYRQVLVDYIEEGIATNSDNFHALWSLAQEATADRPSSIQVIVDCITDTRIERNGVLQEVRNKIEALIPEVPEDPASSSDDGEGEGN